MQFEHVFEPFEFSGIEMPNHIVMPAMHIGMASEGFISEGFTDFYEERAKAGPGPGLMIVGGCYVERRGMGVPNFVALDDDRYIPSLKVFTDRIHRHDTPVAAQLYHGGRYSFASLTGEPSISASAVTSKFTGETPHALTEEEILEVQRHYGEAARRARDAGFDAGELICAAGYLVNQFLSPLTNKREDRYNGDIGDRMTFMRETIAAIKKATGPEFPLICRLSGSDFMEGSHTLKESMIVAAEMERCGVDMINVTGGWHETKVPQIPMEVPRGAFVYLAEGIKSAVEKIPVASSNRINTPELAEEILALGRADLVCMARPFIADPNILRKAYEGRPADIRTCIACNQGCFDHVFQIKPITCTLNPRVNRERETELVPAGTPRKVLVAGGGPAGMEAAWVAAHRGHEVTLCEEDGQLGGQGVLAAIPPGRGEWAEMVRYLRRQVERKGVDVRLNTPVTRGLIKDLHPDVLVVATGARQIEPPIEGAGGDNVVYAWDVLTGDEVTGDRVVVVGGGAVGVETATLLAEQGRDVTVLEMLDRLGRDIGYSSRWVILKDAARLGVKMVDSCCVERITPDGVVADVRAKPETFEADTVVIAAGSRPDDSLEAALTEIPESIEVHKIGDCEKPRKALDAIHEAFNLALTL
ncbi:MAG: FAD-dependent oxidoreductase [Actinobacteria bacterium]|nr:FAD-dependent oxidoreductase [Actinomycetota bacterium]MBU1943309.1 FAD-dependent oxidoreductase [Actinomycetota bacterium]MBU2686573.1 FAD-dependent oxidoreductase [Actinomycetota bacterium]